MKRALIAAWLLATLAWLAAATAIQVQDVERPGLYAAGGTTEESSESEEALALAKARRALADLKPRIKDAIDTLILGTEAAKEHETAEEREAVEQFASLAEETATLLPPLLDMFPEETEARWMLVAEAWPAIELFLTASGVAIEAAEETLEPKPEWQRAAERRIIRAVNGVWVGLADEILDFGRENAGLLLFLLTLEHRVGEFGDALVADPPALDAETIRTREIARERVRALLSDLGLSAYAGGIAALGYVESEEGRKISVALKRIRRRLAALFEEHFDRKADAASPVVDALAGEDGVALLRHLGKVLAGLEPALTRDFDRLAEALEAAGTSPPQAPVAERAPQAPVTLPTDAASELKSSLEKVHYNISDKDLAAMAKGILARHDATAVVNTMAGWLQSEDYTLRDTVIRVLVGLGPAVVAGEDAMIAALGDWQTSVDMARLAMLLAAQGIDLAPVAQAIIDSIDQDSLNEWERGQAMKRLAQLGQAAVPYIPRFFMELESRLARRNAEDPGLKAIAESSDKEPEAFYTDYFATNPTVAQEVRPTAKAFLLESNYDWEFAIKLFKAAGLGGSEVAEALFEQLAGSWRATGDETTVPEHDEQSRERRVVVAINVVGEIPLPEPYRSRVYRLVLERAKDPSFASEAAWTLSKPTLAPLLTADDIRPFLRSTDAKLVDVGAKLAAASPDVATATARDLLAALQKAKGDEAWGWGVHWQLETALKKAADRGVPLVPALTEMVIAGQGGQTPGSILIDLGEKAGEAVPVLMQTLNDRRNGLPTCLRLALIVNEIAPETPPAVTEIFMEAARTPEASLPDETRRLRERAISELMEKPPVTQRTFDLIGELIPSLSGYAQESAINAYAELVGKVEGALTDTWRRAALRTLAKLPKGEHDETLLNAFVTLGATDRDTFEFALAAVRAQLDAYRASSPEERAKFNHYSLDRAREAMIKLTSSALDGETDQRRVDAATLLMEAADVLPPDSAGDWIRKIGVLGPVEGEAEDFFYKALSDRIEDSKAKAEVVASAAAAMGALAPSSQRFRRRLIDTLDIEKLGSEEASAIARSMIRGLEDTDPAFIQEIEENLVTFYLSPAPENTGGEVQQVQDLVLDQIARIGRDALPSFQRIAEARKTLSWNYLPTVKKLVQDVPPNLRKIGPQRLNTLQSQLRDLEGAVAAKADTAPSYREDEYQETLEAIQGARSATEDRLWVARLGDVERWIDLAQGNLAIRGALVVISIPTLLLALSLIAPVPTLDFFRRFTPLEKGKLPVPSWLDLTQVVKAIVFRKGALSAWVEQNRDTAASSFAGLDTVGDRKDYFPLPLAIRDLGGRKLFIEQPLGRLVQELRERFREQRVVQILIRGAGGSGKTSLACQLGEFAMEGRLSKDPMIPVLLETAAISNFEAAIVAEMRRMLDLGSELEPSFVRLLLQKRQLLIIVDHYSELDAQSRRAFVDGVDQLSPKALVVTSRTDTEKPVSPLVVEPMAISEDEALLPFIKSVLKSENVLDRVDPSLPLQASLHLTRVAASPERDREGHGEGVTPMLAKAFAMQIAEQIRRSGGAGPGRAIDFAAVATSIPDIYEEYVNSLYKLNEPSLDQARTDLKRLAWAAVEESLSPRPVLVSRLHEIAGTGEDSEETTKQRYATYVQHIGLLRYESDARRNALFFTLDPVCEFLAAAQLIDDCGKDEGLWRQSIQAITQARQGSTGGRDFLQALAVSVEVASRTIALPAWISYEIKNLARQSSENG